jgi:hypothetical protein
MSRRVPAPPSVRARPDAKSGQALLESFGIIVLLCLILFGMVQVVLMLTANEVVQYSADASVRARAVGFNPFMVNKVSKVTRISLAGRMTTPTNDLTLYDDVFTQNDAGSAFASAVTSNPRSEQYWGYEFPNIPLFLGSQSPSSMYSYLDYDHDDDPAERRWQTWRDPTYQSSGSIITLNQQHRYLLLQDNPLIRAFSDGDTLRISKTSTLADHAELYLE